MWGGSSLPPPHGGMEWGEGRRTDTPPQVQRRTERTQGREGEGKGAAISSCRRAQRRRQPERRPGCGGQYQPPPTPLSSVMKAEEGGEAQHPAPPATPGSLPWCRREAAERGAAAAVPSDAGRGAGSGSRKRSGEGASRAETLPTSRPPCPEEEAVAMVGAERGNAPDPSSHPARLRAHARVRLHPWGEGNPRTHRPPSHFAEGGLPNHRGSRRVIDGGHQLAGQWGRPLCEAGRDYLPRGVPRGAGRCWGSREGRGGREGLGGWGGWRGLKQPRPAAVGAASEEGQGDPLGWAVGRSRPWGRRPRRKPVGAGVRRAARRKCEPFLLFFPLLGVFQYLLWCDLSQALLIGPGGRAAGNPVHL